MLQALARPQRLVSVLPQSQLSSYRWPNLPPHPCPGQWMCKLTSPLNPNFPIGSAGLGRWY